MCAIFTPVELSFSRYKPSSISSQTRVVPFGLGCVMCDLGLIQA